MHKALTSAIGLSLLVAPALLHAQDAAEAPPEAPVQSVINPQVGATYTVEREGTLIERFEARSVTLSDVAVTTATLRLPRAGRRNQGVVTVQSGTVLVREDETWFCTPESASEDSDLTRALLCYADRDENGVFDAIRLKRSRRNLLGRRLDAVPYEMRDSVTQVQPTEGLKQVLVFDGFSNDQVKLRRIEFYLTPSRPESTERLRIDLPGGEGVLEVGDLSFDVQSVSQDRITLTRIE